MPEYFKSLSRERLFFFDRLLRFGLSLMRIMKVSKEDGMPEKRTIERARRDLRQGKTPKTAAGEFVREEIEHVREGKHGARSTKQAIAIGLSQARRAGIPVPGRRRRGRRGSGTVRARRTNPRRSRATLRALKREPRRTVSRRALSRQARRTARSR